jgi:hypothetical protein
MLEAWVEDLAAFPEWAIAEALRQWRQNSRRRPTSADIVQPCRALVGDEQCELACLRRLVDPKEQERARARRTEAEAERQRDSDRRAFLAANPGWTALPGVSDAERRERPMEPDPPLRRLGEIFARVLAETKAREPIPIPGQSAESAGSPVQHATRASVLIQSARPGRQTRGAAPEHADDQQAHCPHVRSEPARL